MTRNKRPWRHVAAQGFLVACALCVVLAATGALASQPKSAPSIEGVVNLNTATPEELQLLPGVGEARAVAIVSMRTQRGGFKDVDELLEVKGIGEAMLEKMRPHVTLTGKTTARKL
jgi:competence protein ComEA